MWFSFLRFSLFFWSNKPWILMSFWACNKGNFQRLNFRKYVIVTRLNFVAKTSTFVYGLMTIFVISPTSLILSQYAVELSLFFLLEQIANIFRWMTCCGVWDKISQFKGYLKNNIEFQSEASQLIAFETSNVLKESSKRMFANFRLRAFRLVGFWWAFGWSKTNIFLFLAMPSHISMFFYFFF